MSNNKVKNVYNAAEKKAKQAKKEDTKNKVKVMKLKKINNNFNCGLKCIDELIDQKKEETENTDLLKEVKNACEQAIQGQCPYDINVKDYM